MITVVAPAKINLFLRICEKIDALTASATHIQYFVIAGHLGRSYESFCNVLHVRKVSRLLSRPYNREWLAVSLLG